MKRNVENLIKTNVIVDFITQNGLDECSFSKLCKISIKQLHLLLKSSGECGLSTVVKVAKVMNIDFVSLFNK